MPLASLRRAIPFVALLGLASAAACSDQAEPPAPAPPGSDGTAQAAPPAGPLPEGAEVMGEFQAHFDARTHQLTFRPSTISEAAPVGQVPGPATQGFGEVKSGLLDVSTESAVVGPDPSYNAGNGCAANRLCAMVKVSNTSGGRTIDSTFVQVTSVTPAGFVGANSASVPTGYPLSAALGLWAHGSLSVGGGSLERWEFELPDPNVDFYFNVKIFGTFLRTSYSWRADPVLAAENTLNNAGSFRNACASPIAQIAGSPFLVGAASGSDNSGAEIALPFPFTLYDLTFDNDQFPYLLLNTNGALGFQSPGTDTNVSLPDSSSLYDYTVFPFWDALTPGPGGVCVGLEGTMPNRTMVFTWLDASVSGVGKLSFSTLLSEGTDRITFQYNRWSTGAANCSSVASGPLRGASATVGVQGPDTSFALASFNSAFLPVHPSACPGPGYQISLSAFEVNPLAGSSSPTRTSDALPAAAGWRRVHSASVLGTRPPRRR
jgi:hypothetical protein